MKLRENYIQMFKKLALSRSLYKIWKIKMQQTVILFVVWHSYNIWSVMFKESLTYMYLGTKFQGKYLDITKIRMEETT